MAWRRAGHPGLGRDVPLDCFRAAQRPRAVSTARHVQRLLGAAVVRAPSASGRRRVVAMAAVYRHRVGGARRHHARGGGAARAIAALTGCSRGRSSCSLGGLGGLRPVRKAHLSTRFVQSTIHPLAGQPAPASCGRGHRVSCARDYYTRRALMSPRRRATGEVRDERPSRVVAERRVQRNARPGHHAGDSLLPEAPRNPWAVVSRQDTHALSEPAFAPRWRCLREMVWT